MTNNTNDRKQCFPPQYHPACKLLILSTIPGDESLARGMYYAHKTNLFWDYMYRILMPGYNFFQPFSQDTPASERYQLLLQNNIALWDVISDCLSIDARDSSITDPKFNDIPGFIAGTQIKAILCNGGNAHGYLKESGQLAQLKIPIHICGSTSTSNRNNPFVTLTHWRDKITQYL